MPYSLEAPFAFGGPITQAHFREYLEDFVVIEHLPEDPEGQGQGEHEYLYLTKRGQNTEWVAEFLAKQAGIKKMDIGFCGLKDRQAVATQWFSLYRPKGAELNWDSILKEADGSLILLKQARSKSKLRRGAHAYNQFTIILRAIDTAFQPALNQRLTLIKELGAPNYFGEQRFGRHHSNLLSAQKWLQDGVPLSQLKPKGMIISAARSYLFNLVLGHRVMAGNWQTLLPGDTGTEPTGPLWGRGRPRVTDDTLALEQIALDAKISWLDGLEHCGLNQERRPLTLRPIHLNWQFEDNHLILNFGLAPGQFATSLLRELVVLQTVSRV